MGSISRTVSGCAAALTLALVVLAATPGGARAALGYFPGQFIAKQYTEALGRVPDQGGWQGQVAFYQSQGCSAVTLASQGEGIYNSEEYNWLGYDNAARILTLYRGALSREPDRPGFDNWMYQLNTGMAWSTVVSKFFHSDEFLSMVPRICTGVKDGRGSSYYWGAEPALAMPTTGLGFTGTQDQLQLQLNLALPGSTVYLAQRALVMLTSRLTIPAGVTLTTTGGPDNRHYAQMGRLVRGSAFNDQLVYVTGGAALTNVWVDGARNTPENSEPSRSNIRMLGGTGTTVSNNRLTNTAGMSNVLALGAFDGYGCRGMVISGNVITAYSSDFYTAWTDGLSVTCEDASVQDNQIVDTTDVGIVLYRSCPNSSTPLPGQSSLVKGNTVLSAGNSMYGALGHDPLWDGSWTCSFEWASITQNLFWTSPNTHFRIGLYSGTRAWSGLTGRANTGYGASVTNNTTGSLTARVTTGIAVSGMLNATVNGNTTRWEHPGGLSRCPDVDFAASITQGTASGTFSPTPTDVIFDGCV